MALTFVWSIGIGNWPVVLGLCLGGIIAAPVAAHLTRRLKAETLMTLVGVVLIVLSMRTIATSLGLGELRKAAC